MRSERGFPIRRILILNFLVLAINDAVLAQAIDTGLFTQNRLRQCSSATACIGGDPTLQVQADFDLSVTGIVTTLVGDPGLGAQAATSAGYDGIALTPALSAYAYTVGAQRYTLVSFGFQRYEFLADGEVTIGGTLTYSQSGQTAPRANNPRGIVIGSLMGFQMDGDVFNPDNCNVFTDVTAVNAAGFLVTCLVRNGQEFFPGGPLIDFDGLQNFQVSEFDVPTGPITNGIDSVELTISGQAGDVFFLGANIAAFAHLGGFANSRNTLSIDIDQPELVQPTFGQQTFVPAPARSVGIDIKPGSDTNCLRMNGRGVIPVAILGSDKFDVLDIDQSSLMFELLSVAVRGQSRPMCHAEYSNGDEFLDLVCQFENDAEGWSPNNEEASVVGRLTDGRPITGTDSICVVP